MTYTIPQAAVLIGRTVSGTRWLIRVGKLVGEKVIDPNGRAIWLVSQDAIDSYKGASQ